MGEGSQFYHRIRKIKRMGTRMEEQVVGVSPKLLRGKRKPRSQKSSSATYRCLAPLRAKEQRDSIVIKPYDRVSRLDLAIDPHPLAEIKQPLGYSHATQTNPLHLIAFAVVLVGEQGGSTRDNHR